MSTKARDERIFARRQKILDTLRCEGRIYIPVLCRTLGVSAVTIRGELSALESAGQLIRIRGGAVAPNYMLHLGAPAAHNAREHSGCISEACRLIKDHETLLLGSGALLLQLFAAIPPNLELNILTNSIRIALESGANPNFNVLLLGGCVDQKSKSSYGEDMIAQLTAYQVDKLFFEADGISEDGALSVSTPRKAEILRAMMTCAGERIALVRKENADRASFVFLADAGQVDRVIIGE